MPRVPGGAPAWAGPLGLAVGFVALAGWSWGRWTDVHIDFGGELYTAWRLSEGDALYRDVACRHGPLSPHVNALLFRVFGVSLQTLVAANLLLFAGITAAVYALWARVCDRPTGTLAAGVLLGLFGFSQYTGIANYNYVTPYTHFQTHAVALTLAMLASLGAGLRGLRWGWQVAGLCLGLVLLTKAELSLPALGSAALACALASRSSYRRAAGAAARLLAGAGLPVVGFGAWLLRELPPREAWRGLLGNFAHLQGLGDDRFYAGVTGFDEPLVNALRALVALAVLVGAAGATALADRAAPASWRRPGPALALGVALAAVLVLALPRVAWLPLARALPLATAGVAAGLLFAWWRTRHQPEPSVRLELALLVASWALLLLAKTPLNARFGHYGFVLSMPATLVWVAAWAYALPALLRRAYGGGGLARALAIAAVAAVVILALRQSDAIYRRKTLAIGPPGERVAAEAPPLSRRGVVLARALERLEALGSPQDSLLVLPQGVILNYWLRWKNPVPHFLFVPTEIEAFGEGAMLAALEVHPPDWVAVVDRPYAEFGVGPFGVDPAWGAALLSWVDAHYQVVETLGAEPFGGRGFGVQLLRRAAPP